MSLSPTATKRLPLKRLFKIVNGATPSSGVESYWNGDIPWVTPEDLGSLKSRMIVETRRLLTEDGLASCGASMVPARSLILSTRAPIGHLAITAVDCCTNQGCKALVPRDGQLDSYFYYQLIAIREGLQARGRGSTFKELSTEDLSQVELWCPPPTNRSRIAAHLDRETARIDALVTEKEALLRLLEEKRASLISHAVTRGLNPKAKLKPSGIPWLGDVPEHWSVQPLKRLTTTIKTGTTPNTEDVTAEGDFDWYTPGDFGNDIHLSPSKRRIFRDSPSFTSLRIFPAGTILFVGIGATLGKCSVSKVPCSANQQINAIVPTRETDSVFLCLSLRAQAEGIRLMANASTIGILNQERTSAIPIAVPPPEEQRAIAAECLRISSATDTVITDIQTSIHLLREKRTSLISAAVTGEMAVT